MYVWGRREKKEGWGGEEKEREREYIVPMEKNDRKIIK
jgi:hypothetical protein